MNIKDYKCRNCGHSEFFLSYFLQASRDYKILRSGKVSKKCIVQRPMSDGTAVLYCAKCGKTIDNYTYLADGTIDVEGDE